MKNRDTEHGEEQGDPKPRFHPSLDGGWLEYLKLDSPQSVYSAHKAVWAGRPVVLQKAPLISLTTSCGFEQLRTLKTMENIQVMCSEPKRNRFIKADPIKNIYGSMYHVREPETRLLAMTISELIDCASTWTQRRVYASIPLQLEEANVDTVWFNSFLQAQKFGSVSAVHMQIGTLDGLLPAQYNLSDRFLAQMTGRRRILLIPPDHAFRGMYPYPMHHPYDTYSMVDLDGNPLDLGMWPLSTHAKGVRCVLRPGDVLFIPAYWFVHVQFLEKEDVALSIEVCQGSSQPPGRDSIPLRVSRAIEERVAEFEGIGGVRRWLQLIGKGEEHAAIDLSTVKGYKRIVLCQSIRDDIDENLGRGAWGDLLPAMCRGRLKPTTWLNAEYREPLYLSDKPVQKADSRTEEEKKYPELFRKKLKAAGWTVPEITSTVPIPGYNMPMNADYRSI